MSREACDWRKESAEGGQPAVLRVGELVLNSTSGESTVRIELNIKQHSPPQRTFLDDKIWATSTSALTARHVKN